MKISSPTYVLEANDVGEWVLQNPNDPTEPPVLLHELPDDVRVKWFELFNRIPAERDEAWNRIVNDPEWVLPAPRTVREMQFNAWVEGRNPTFEPTFGELYVSCAIKARERREERERGRGHAGPSATPAESSAPSKPASKRRSFTPAADRVAEQIRQAPGQTTEQLVLTAKCAAQTIRKVYAQQLKPAGYYKYKRGHYPPGYKL